MSDDNIAPGATPLNLSAMEARVLGALMEKQLTTPDAYPLTLNSLVLACNQKTSREPISNYRDGEVQRCLDQLRERKLIEVEYGSRANRFLQRLTRELHLERPGQAVLSLLLLRGPQTVNELFSRGQRGAGFDSEAQVEELLQLLSAKTKPFIRLLPRLSGQREQRYAQLLTGEPNLVEGTENKASQHFSVKGISANSDAASESIEARLAYLEEQVARLLRLNGLSDDSDNEDTQGN